MKLVFIAIITGVKGSADVKTNTSIRTLRVFVRRPRARLLFYCSLRVFFFLITRRKRYVFVYIYLRDGPSYSPSFRNSVRRSSYCSFSIYPCSSLVPDRPPRIICVGFSSASVQPPARFGRPPVEDETPPDGYRCDNFSTRKRPREEKYTFRRGRK